VIRLANLSRQHQSLREEIEPALREILLSGEFVLGEPVAQFEEAFARYCGAEFAVGVNSGTSALHLALLAAGISAGDEVITTPFTFVATAAAIAYIGARPVFVDISPDNFTIDPSRIAGAITSRTRAIVPVHLYGHAADMDPILEVARANNLAVIEDACQAQGALYRNQRVGCLGDAGCFSFYPAKNLGACGEGGLMVTRHASWARKARSWRTWGTDAEDQALTRGYNYRMDAFQGAVLSIKLRQLDHWNAIRRRHAELYCESIAGPSLQAPPVASWAQHVFHIFAVRTRDRGGAQAAFEKRGIETRVHYPMPIHLMDRFRDLGYVAGDFPHAEQAAREVLSIPVHPELGDGEVATVAEALRVVSLENKTSSVSVLSSSNL